jgi:hypothetical protein
LSQEIPARSGESRSDEFAANISFGELFFVHGLFVFAQKSIIL